MERPIDNVSRCRFPESDGLEACPASDIEIFSERALDVQRVSDPSH